MAKTVQTLVTDDLDGSADAEEMTFGLDGAWFTIDLGPKNAEKLREALTAFVEVATPTEFPENALPKARRRVEPRADAPDPGVYREFWKGEENRLKFGLPEFNDRGRIPQVVTTAYHAAQDGK